MRKLALTSIIVLSTLTSHGIASAGQPDAFQKGLIKATDKGYAELIRQMKDPRTPPLSYWIEGVAVCETSQDWDGTKGAGAGHFAGGLGISQTTWYNYGGYEFARRVEKATPTAQIVVANRIAVFGYNWKDRYRTWADKIAGKGLRSYPHWVWGWGCSKEYLGDPCGRFKDGNVGKWQARKYRDAWQWYQKHCK